METLELHKKNSIIDLDAFRSFHLVVFYGNHNLRIFKFFTIFQLIMIFSKFYSFYDF